MAKLQAEGQSIREFVRILRLHERYPVDLVEQAVKKALEYGCIHADGVELCVRQLGRPEATVAPLDLAGRPRLSTDLELPDLRRYEQLLVAGR